MCITGVCFLQRNTEKIAGEEERWTHNEERDVLVVLGALGFCIRIRALSCQLYTRMHTHTLTSAYASSHVSIRVLSHVSSAYAHVGFCMRGLSRQLLEPGYFASTFMPAMPQLETKRKIRGKIKIQKMVLPAGGLMRCASMYALLREVLVL